jgi:predicted phage terminase large subunit-like protein
LHPAREPLEVLALIREQLGEYDFAGQYQQTPAPLGGGIVKREWLTRHAYAPWQLPAPFECILQSWDSAAKASELADYSVCTTWGVAAGVLYLLDVWRQKVDYPQLKRAALALALQFRPDTILVEDKSSGIQLVQELAQAGIYGVKPYKPSGEKVMRLHQHTGTIELGQMRIPQQAPWLPDYCRAHHLSAHPLRRSGGLDHPGARVHQADAAGAGAHHVLRRVVCAKARDHPALIKASASRRAHGLPPSCQAQNRSSLRERDGWRKPWGLALWREPSVNVRDVFMHPSWSVAAEPTAGPVAATRLWAVGCPRHKGSAVPAR